jgi:hypothetical protein
VPSCRYCHLYSPYMNGPWSDCNLQLQANLFDTPYAHALLAIRGQPPETYADTASSTAPDAPSSQEEAAEQDPLGLALYFFNFSTWTGRPGIYVSPFVLFWFWFWVMCSARMGRSVESSGAGD